MAAQTTQEAGKNNMAAPGSRKQQTPQPTTAQQKLGSKSMGRSCNQHQLQQSKAARTGCHHCQRHPSGRPIQIFSRQISRQHSFSDHTSSVDSSHIFSTRSDTTNNLGWHCRQHSAMEQTTPASSTHTQPPADQRLSHSHARGGNSS